jgi:hypothetical protein
MARAHARSGDAAAISGYLGTGDCFDRAVADFSEATPTGARPTTQHSCGPGIQRPGMG